MIDLLGKYFSNNASLEEKAQIEAWRNESDENAAEFFEHSALWNEVLGEVKVDEALALSNVMSKIDASESNGKVVPLRTEGGSRWNHLLKYAAALVIGLGVAFYFLGQSGMDSTTDSFAIVSTGMDQKEEVTLPDGSKVYLSGSSKLTYSKEFEGRTREVMLTGKAFFEITRNEQKPFIVRTEESEVTVLGTSFLVNTATADLSTEVVVETGKVAVSKNTKKYKESTTRVELVPGEMVTVSNASEMITKSTNSNKNYLSWKTSLIDFERTSLRDVFNTIEEVYKVKLNVSNEAIYDCELSAKFDHRPISSVLEIISQTFGLEVEKVSRKEFNLSGSGCFVIQ